MSMCVGGVGYRARVPDFMQMFPMFCVALSHVQRRCSLTWDPFNKSVSEALLPWMGIRIWQMLLGGGGGWTPRPHLQEPGLQFSSCLGTACWWLPNNILGKRELTSPMLGTFHRGCPQPKTYPCGMQRLDRLTATWGNIEGSRSQPWAWPRSCNHMCLPCPSAPPVSLTLLQALFFYSRDPQPLWSNAWWSEVELI